MNYFVTGATGFIGRFLVARILQDEDAVVHVLARESSRDKVEKLKRDLGESAAKRIHAVWGDIADDGLVSASARKKIAGKIDHIFHLAAVYDMNMDDATADRVNTEGTRNVVAFANSLGGDVRLHHMSSVAVAGIQFEGQFTEDMFDEGQPLDHPYYRTKFESEKLVREECRVPFRVYRPGAVVGSSETGEMDKVDGPYYFFKSIQRVRDSVPRWLPLVGIDGGRVPIVPVDYVALAMHAIAHRKEGDGECFHLLQSPSPSVGELLGILLEAAHGPEITRTIDVGRFGTLPSPIRQVTNSAIRVVPSRVLRMTSQTLGVPVSVLGYVFNPAIFDDRKARAALRDTGIKCPDIRDYAEKLFQYWEIHLDLDVKVPASLQRRIGGKVVLITGASSGIGFSSAKKIAAGGAKVILVARTPEKLEQTKHIIEKMGGEAHCYPTDLNNLESIDAMSQQVLHDFGHVDILINNAGRSIRRAVFESFDRFHDFERTMQLNYFGAIRLIMNLLPEMARRKSGHIINISSIGVLANAARFSAYVASKAALDAYTRCLSAEVRSRNIHTTAIYMPLVRTPMIAPTKMYDYVPTWTPEQAADTVVDAILKRPKSIATPVGTAAALSYAVWPKVNDYILSKGFQLFPSSGAAKGIKEGGKPTIEQVVFANLFKGEHW
ncbi:SDR family oxidoreductase [Algiphilus sp.]|uniref:SDR family oxidoreductase n=1 Tax=Algiphilus sp. TaxID=1872431 RepID=UPI003B52EE29